jgi:GNAT superfamily N-acetyltransferase
VSFEIEVRPYGDPDVVRMVAEVQAEYVALYGGPDAAEVDPQEFAPPRGLFLVGSLDGHPVAMGGWRRVNGDDAEIKRMYVIPPARRRGLARALLEELERTASGAGVVRLVLNTGPEQPAAIAMYRRSGYDPVPGFGHYARFPGALFYGKALPPVAAAGRQLPGAPVGPPQGSGASPVRHTNP